jgi:hypothetical protein
MFGILIGTLCLLGLIAVVRGRRWRHGYGHGRGGWGYSPYRGYGVDGMGAGPRWMLRSLFYRLGTSPSQEKVILEAVSSLRDQSGKLRGEWQQSKSEIAQAVRGEALDETKVQGTFKRHDGLLSELRKAALDAMAKVHAVLDPDQRKALAKLVEHPHRHAGAWAC